MKKIFPAFISCAKALLCAALFSTIMLLASCTNFMNGASVKQELQAQID